MTESEAQEVVSVLGDAYRMSQRRLDWYARALLRFPAGPTAQVLERLVESEKAPPTIAVIMKAVKQQLETIGAASPTFQRRSDRMEALVTWRAVLEEPTTETRSRDDAFDRIRWMDPACTAAEWREARTIADQRHLARNGQLVAEGHAPRTRAALSWPQPPPPDPQPVLSRPACAAGMRALWQGLERRQDGATITATVLQAIRATPREDAAAVGDDW